MAMAFGDKNRHYDWERIQLRHIRETARRCGMESSFETLLARLITEIPTAIEKTSSSLPKDFSAVVSDAVFEGMTKRRLLLVAQ